MKICWIVLLLGVCCLASPAEAAEVQTVLDTDSFGGTNGNTLPTYSAHWANAGTNMFNDVTIRGTPGIGGSFAAAINASQTWTDDMWAEIKVDAANVADSIVAVCVRQTKPTERITAYCGGRDNTHFGADYRIWYTTGGVTYTSLAASGQTVLVNDVVNLQIVGPSLTLRVNGTIVLGPTADATIASGGNTGIWLNDSDGTKRLAGTWRAGSVTTTAPVYPWTGIIDPSRAIDWSGAGVVGGIPTTGVQCGSTVAAYTGTAATINNAITACTTNGGMAPDAAHPGYVLLGSGTFTLSSAITVNKSYVYLKGGGPTSTIVKFSGTPSCSGFGGTLVCLGDPNGQWIGAGDCALNMNGCSGNWDTTWTGTSTGGAGTYTKGDTRLIVGSTANMVVGRPMILNQMDETSDDGGLINSSWCGSPYGVGPTDCPTKIFSTEGGPLGSLHYSSEDAAYARPRSQHQVVKVANIVNGTTVDITPGIYMPNWRTAMTPKIASWGAVNSRFFSGIGIQDLTLDATGRVSNGQNGITWFYSCDNCWMSNVRSINGLRNHINFVQSDHGEVRDSYFYGDASSGAVSYGIECQLASDILIINNIFHRLTAPLQSPCVGSVDAYNYAFDNFTVGGPCSDLGGNVTNCNQATHWLSHQSGGGMRLEEGNQNNGAITDFSHGNTPLGTLFRNAFSGNDDSGVKNQYRRPIVLHAFARAYNVIGNVLGATGMSFTYNQTTPGCCDDLYIYVLGYGGGLTGGTDAVVASSLFRWGNYDTATGTTRFVSGEVPTTGIARINGNPVPATMTLPSSFFLSGAPAFWATPWGTPPWPAIGPDVTGGTGPAGHTYDIPAKRCFSNLSNDPAYPASTPRIKLFNSDNCKAGGDATPPVVSVSTIVTSAVAATTLTLTWTKATDAVTAQTALQYEVCRSTANNIATVVACETNGVVIQSFIADIATFNATGLAASTGYFFNVVVRDAAGNKTAYTTVGVTTLDVPVTSGLPAWDDSWNGVHSFFVFNPTDNANHGMEPPVTTCAQLAAIASRYDFGWGGGCNTEVRAANPGFVNSVYRDGTQGGQLLGWYRANHPDWLFYICTASPCEANPTTPLVSYGYSPVPFSYNAMASAVIPDFSNAAARDYKWTSDLLPVALGAPGAMGFDNSLLDNDFAPNPLSPGGQYMQAKGVYPNATPANLQAPPFNNKFVGRGSYADVLDPPYTQAFINYEAYLTGQVHSLSPPRLSIFNGAPMIVYNNASLRTAHINAIDGQLIEGGTLGPEWPGDSRKLWLGQIHFIEDMNAADKGVYVLQDALGFTTNASIPTPWIRFTLASYLLAKGRHAGIGIVTSGGYKNTYWPATEFNAANGAVGITSAVGIGSPCGPMAQTAGPAGSEDGLFVREHSGGVSAVNASSTSNYALNLPAGPWVYRDLYNNLVTSPVNMAAKTGNVFLKSGASSGIACATGSVDSTPPALVTGPTAAPVTTTTAQIVGTTNEPSDWRIDYGLTVAYGGTVIDPTFTLGQAVTLTGLTPGATYHYRATFKDPSGNSAASTDNTFTTPPLATLTITTTSFPPGTLGAPYTDQATATGGSPASGFQRIVPVTLPRPTVDLVNFPHWICKTFPEWRTVANGGFMQSDSAFDLVWYASTALATRLSGRLDYVKARYSPTLGEWCGYVRLPDFPAAADTVIFAAYGSGTVTTDQGSGAAVFSPMGGHIAAHWTLDTFADQTLNPSDLIPSATPPTFAVGKVNFALSFGNGQWAKTSAAAKLTQRGPMTLCLWANYTDALTTALLATGGNGGNFGLYAGDQVAGIPKFFVTQAGVLKTVSSAAARNTGSDVFLCGGYTGSNVVLYVNGGAEVVTGTAVTGMLDADPVSNMVFGQVDSGGASWCTSCKIDEATLYDQWMGAPWIAARYAAENAPSAVTLGTPTPSTGGGYVWSIVTGALPAGLTLNGSVISGTPTVAGTANFTLRVADGVSTADRPLSITINAPITITETSLPNGVLGQPYNQLLTASGGTTPLNLALVTGHLPAGATLTPTGIKTQGTNVLTAPGFYIFTVRATDQAQASTDVRYSMFVASATGISYSPLPIYWDFTSGTVNVKYSYDCVNYAPARTGLAFGASPVTAQLPQSNALCLTLDSSTEADVTAPAFKVSGEYVK